MTMQVPSNLKQLESWFSISETKGELTLCFRGDWVCLNIGLLESELLKLDFSKNIPLKVRIEKECVMDTAGACLIARIIKMLERKGRHVHVAILSSSPFLHHFLKIERTIQLPSQLHLGWHIRLLNYIGQRVCFFSKTTLSMLNFFGEVLITSVQTLKSIHQLRWVSVFRQSEEIGIKALPIIGLISFLIGMVLSYQSINQLSRFGAEIYTIDFLGISILREISVLLTAIVIAGRSGSAFAAQIGVMVLNQEIDAIRMLGLNPVLILVIPRLLAIMVCMPLLVFFSMIMGLLGGMLMTSLVIDTTLLHFIHQLQRAISLNTFWVGMSKAPLFAMIIGIVGCFRGFQVKGSAESVGRMTTQSVVESIFLVIICDAFMSILFSYLRI